MGALAEEIMNRSFVKIQSNEPASDALHKLAETGLDVAIVIDEIGDLCGIFGGEQFVDAIAHDQHNLLFLKPVSHFMAQHVPRINPKNSTTEVAKIMDTQNWRTAIVVNGTIPIGIINYSDLIKYWIDENIFNVNSNVENITITFIVYSSPRKKPYQVLLIKDELEWKLPEEQCTSNLSLYKFTNQYLEQIGSDAKIISVIGNKVATGDEYEKVAVVCLGRETEIFNNHLQWWPMEQAGIKLSVAANRELLHEASKIVSNHNHRQVR